MSTFCIPNLASECGALALSNLPNDYREDPWCKCPDVTSRVGAGNLGLTYPVLLREGVAESWGKGPESDLFEGAPGWEDFVLMIIRKHGLLYT